MLEIQHLNLGWLHAPPFPPACCHGLLIRSEDGIALVETGIGLQDIAEPERRIGRDAIQGAGFQFRPEMTAVHQLARQGIAPAQVTDLILTHCDPDHAGGLADFPGARVHVAAEEKQNLDAGNPRYGAAQFDHGPRWITYGKNDDSVLDLPARRLTTSLSGIICLVPLFGHTLGHCGVAVERDGRWLLHVGDAYYLRDELSMDEHPVNALAEARADDDSQRRQSLQNLRRLARRTDLALTMTGYHDVNELPDGIPQSPDDSP